MKRSDKHRPAMCKTIEKVRGVVRKPCNAPEYPHCNQCELVNRVKYLGYWCNRVVGTKKSIQGKAPGQHSGKNDDDRAPTHRRVDATHFGDNISMLLTVYHNHLRVSLCKLARIISHNPALPLCVRLTFKFHQSTSQSINSVELEIAIWHNRVKVPATRRSTSLIPNTVLLISQHSPVELKQAIVGPSRGGQLCSVHVQQDP